MVNKRLLGIPGFTIMTAAANGLPTVINGNIFNGVLKQLRNADYLNKIVRNEYSIFIILM